MTANNSLYGINRANNKWFNPTVPADNAEISEIKIQEGIDIAEDEVGNTINFLICEKVSAGPTEPAGAQKQIVNTIEMKGGFKADSFNGIPLTADCTVLTESFRTLPEDWKLYEMADWGWMDEDGRSFPQGQYPCLRCHPA